MEKATCESSENNVENLNRLFQPKSVSKPCGIFKHTWFKKQILEKLRKNVFYNFEHRESMLNLEQIWHQLIPQITVLRSKMLRSTIYRRKGALQS